MAHSDFAKGQLPLQGVQLCCTSLAQDVRTSLADHATEMGAVHKLDLTADVTHLIVGHPDTPKYRYTAKERPDIRVLRPSFIEAVRELWIDDAEIDLRALETAHALPPFAGLSICLTGFEDPEERQSLSEAIERHGGTYHGDLTKAVSHLIAAVAQGAKYTHAAQWGIPTVSEKWLHHSVQRGMAVDESFYHPAKPREDQGTGAWRRVPKGRTSLGKRGREGQQQDGAAAGKKKLRRTASSRLESQSQDLWSNMSVPEAASGRASHADQWNDEVQVEKSYVDLGRSTGPANVQEQGFGVAFAPKEQDDRLFSGCWILICAFDRKRTDHLKLVLEDNGGHVVRSQYQLQDAATNPAVQRRYLLLPRATSNPESYQAPDDSEITATTEWWVERCIHYKQRLDPKHDVLSQPLCSEPITGMSDLCVSTTGFSGVDLRQVAEAVKKMGASYQEKILPSTSVLISATSTIRKEKAFYANKHRIPSVSADWLWECLRTKIKRPFDNYKVALPVFDPKEFAAEPSLGSPAPTEQMQRTANSSSKVKDDHSNHRLSRTRKKQHAPSLALQVSRATPAPPATKAKQPPIVHVDEDEDDDPLVNMEPALEPERHFSPRRSQPLNEVSANLSPRKGSHTHEHERNDERPNETKPKPQPSAPNSPTKSAPPPSEPAQPTSPTHHPRQPQPARQQEALTAELTTLISRPSAPSAPPPPPKRKTRPLGRNPSSLSNRSHPHASAETTSTSTRTNVLPDSASPTALAPHADADADVPTLSQARANGFGSAFPPPDDAAVLPQGTQVGYEVPDAAEAREAMGRRLGTAFEVEGAGRVGTGVMGVVRDVGGGRGREGSGGGGGERVSRRRR